MFLQFVSAILTVKNYNEMPGGSIISFDSFVLSMIDLAFCILLILLILARFYKRSLFFYAVLVYDIIYSIFVYNYYKKQQIVDENMRIMSIVAIVLGVLVMVGI